MLPQLSAAERERVSAEGVLPCDPSGKTVVTAQAALRGDRAEITAVIADADGRLSSLTGLIPLESQAQGLESPVLTPCAEGFSVRLISYVRPEIVQPFCLRQIASAALTPMEGVDTRPGAVLVRRTENPDFWALAKAHASSEAAIQAANPETEIPSRWLLIPKVG